MSDLNTGDLQRTSGGDGATQLHQAENQFEMTVQPRSNNKNVFD
jgi:hypothetical protein